MLLSMTGHGDAAGQNSSISVTIEIRSVNNRHLKVSFRCPDAFLALESQVEKLIRQRVDRGSIYVSLHVRRLDRQQLNQLHTEVLTAYWQHLTDLATTLGTAPAQSLAQLLNLPGVVDSGDTKLLAEEDWPLVEEVLGKAIDKLQDFREREGAHMVAELKGLGEQIETHVVQIFERAPLVIREYRDRLRLRLADLTQGSDVNWNDSDLLREMSQFADRCDITEEISRLRSHLVQFNKLFTVRESMGRKLDFLCQELFREINTIGSKANDVVLSHHVLDVKAVIEKIRELVQNVE